MVNPRVMRVKRPDVQDFAACIALNVADATATSQNLLEKILAPSKRRHLVVGHIVQDVWQITRINPLSAIWPFAIDVQWQASKRAADKVHRRPDRRNAQRVINRDIDAGFGKTAAPAHDLQEILRRNRCGRVFKIAGFRLAEAIKESH